MFDLHAHAEAQPPSIRMLWIAFSFVLVVTFVATGRVAAQSAEQAAEITLQIADAAITEKDTETVTLAFTVTASAAVPDGISFTYQTIDGSAVALFGDYTAASNTILLTDTQHIIRITVQPDLIVEADETFTVQLSAASADGHTITISDATATGTILNDDFATITVFDAKTVEGDSGTSHLVFTATIDAPTGGINVAYSTFATSATANVDYVHTAGLFRFHGGADQVVPITVTVNGDSQLEPNETLSMTLTWHSGSDAITWACPSAVGTILNDDTVNISAENVTVPESAAQALVTVTLDYPTTDPVQIEWATADESAKSGQDYTKTSGILTIQAGKTEGMLAVNLHDDGLDEFDESLRINFSGSVSGLLTKAYVTATITDNDELATISFDDALSGSEESGSATATIQLSGPSGKDISFHVATMADSAEADVDYVTISERVTVTAGMTNTTVVVTMTDDHIDEDAESFSLILTDIANARLAESARDQTVTRHREHNKITITIDDNDTAAVNVSTTNITLSESQSAPFYLILNSQPTSAMSLSITTDDPQVCTVGQHTITFGPHNYNISQHVTVYAADALITEGDGTCTVQIGNITSADAKYRVIDPADVTVTVKNLDILSVTLTDGSADVTSPLLVATTVALLTLLTLSAVKLSRVRPSYVIRR